MDFQNIGDVVIVESRPSPSRRWCYRHRYSWTLPTGLCRNPAAFCYKKSSRRAFFDEIVGVQTHWQGDRSVKSRKGSNGSRAPRPTVYEFSRKPQEGARRRLPRAISPEFLTMLAWTSMVARCSTCWSRSVSPLRRCSGLGKARPSRSSRSATSSRSTSGPPLREALLGETDPTNSHRSKPTLRLFWWALAATTWACSAPSSLPERPAPQRPPPALALRVGTSGDYAPFSTLQNDERSGFDIELALEVARSLQRPVQWVPFVWPELGAKVQENAFHVAMSGVTWKPERAVVGYMTRAVASGGPCLLGDPRSSDAESRDGGCRSQILRDHRGRRRAEFDPQRVGLVQVGGEPRWRRRAARLHEASLGVWTDGRCSRTAGRRPTGA